MKVYVITTGSYSDYQIHSIYTSKELADKYEQTVEDSNGVDEWDTDNYPEGEIKEQYGVTIRISDGNITPYPFGLTKVITNKKSITKFASEIGKDGGILCAIQVFSTVSPEHAQKVAIEKRQDILRNHGDKFSKNLGKAYQEYSKSWQEFTSIYPFERW